jgi:hypothetical protein
MTGLCELLSPTPPGLFISEASIGDISGNGRFAVFRVSQTDGVRLYDRASGSASWVPMPSSSIQISNDGRYLTSSGYAATGLFPLMATGIANIWRFDLWTEDLQPASITVGGTGADAASFWPGISDNGRYVIYQTRASNVVPVAPLVLALDPVTVVTDMGPGSSLGVGTSGSTGYPPRTHVVDGTFGTSWGLSLLYANANVPAFLALKVAPAGVPSQQLGGQVLPWPPDFLINFTTPAGVGGGVIAGPLVLPIAWHPTTPAGTQVQAQWATIDPANPFGATLTNSYIVDRP